MFTGLVALVASFFASTIRLRWVRYVAFALAAASAVGGSWWDSADFVKQLIAAVVLLSVLVFGVAKIVRFNLLGYFLLLMTLALMSGAGELLEQPDRFYRANGYGLAAVLILLLLWPLVSWLRTAKPAAA